MPTLHRYAERDGYFVKGISRGEPVAFRLTPEGEQYLVETLALPDGGKFAGDTLKWLYGKKWATQLDYVPRDSSAKSGAAVVTSVADAVAAPPAPSRDTPEVNEIVFQGVFHVALTALDQVLLDQCSADVVRTLARTGAVVFGPLPLPSRVESYTVQREAGRSVYDVRLYRRALQVRLLRRHTMEAMNDMSLPREVDLQVEMKPH